MSVWDGWTYESHAMVALLNHWISTITYHPDWSFRATYDVGLNDLAIVVQFQTLNPYDNNAPYMQASWRTLDKDDMRSRATLVNAIHGMIYQLQNHEIDEWLKVDGVHVLDPHTGVGHPAL